METKDRIAVYYDKDNEWLLRWNIDSADRINCLKTLIDITEYPKWNKDIQDVEFISNDGCWITHTMSFKFSSDILRKFPQKIAQCSFEGDHVVIMTSENVSEEGNAINDLTMFVIEKDKVDFYSNMDFEAQIPRPALLKAQSTLLINFVSQLRSQYKQN